MSRFTRLARSAWPLGAAEWFAIMAAHCLASPDWPVAVGTEARLLKDAAPIIWC